jgi:peroxiredoxin (alkyl hydroperoxide reductase subunit C)
MNCCNNENKSGCCGDTNEHVKIGAKMIELDMPALIENDVNKISLTDYKGKWYVLFFYPANFTFVCPTELEELANMYDKFRAIDCEILAVSADTAYSHKAWKDTSPAIGKVKYPMLSDSNHKLARFCNVLIEEEGMTLRGTFIVDPDGVVRGIEVNDNSIGRSAKELLRKVSAAQFVREHGDKVCPASWEPGDETLTPGMDLVGKI